ncbi:MAG: hypothetical protein ABI051_09530 [Vicinamibacterales bacterium]
MQASTRPAPVHGRFLRAGVLAVACGVAAALSVWLAQVAKPGITVEMDRALPRALASGFYAPEAAGELTYAWTGARAQMKLNGVSRATIWNCAILLRGARAASMEQPLVTVLVDGAVASTIHASNDFEEVDVSVPARRGTGLTVGIVTTPTFHPGGSDPRELGVQVDRVSCQPASRLARPPLVPVRNAAIAAAATAGVFALGGAVVTDALVAVLVLVAGIAVLLGTGAALLTGYSATLAALALWVSGGTLILLKGLQARQAERVDRPTIAAVMVSAVALVLQLGALLHPSKSLVDALFQAHRLDAVLAGQYFFTQAMPDGVQFPYAIGLYVFASPLARMVADHVALLRIVVATVGVIAGGFLYWLCRRAFVNPWAAVCGVAFFHLVPLPYIVVGNGNLTNAFGQSVAVAAAVLAAALTLGPRRYGQAALLTAVVVLAFCSHVSTVVLLLTTLAALAIWFFLFRNLRVHAAALVACAALALTFSTAAYYAHFTNVYVEAYARMRADPAAASPSQTDRDPAVEALVVPSWPARAGTALRQTADHVGWPLLVLAIVGLIPLRLAGRTERLSSLAIAWGVVWLLFVGAGTVTKVGAQYERYAVEFLGRVNLATYPAAVLLAASAVDVAWDPSRPPSGMRRIRRGFVLVLVAAAAVGGIDSWLGWLR